MQRQQATTKNIKEESTFWFLVCLSLYISASWYWQCISYSP
jgi:hypothetical protein